MNEPEASAPPPRREPDICLTALNLRAECQPPVRPALRAAGRTQNSYAPASTACPMSRATSPGKFANRCLKAGVRYIRVHDTRRTLHLAPGRPRCAFPSRHADPSAQPNCHDHGDLQRGAHSQDQKRAQVAGQAARWLGLLYFSAYEDEKGPVQCSKAALT